MMNSSSNKSGAPASCSQIEPCVMPSSIPFRPINVNDARRKNTPLQKMALIQDELVLIEEQLALLECSNTVCFNEACRGKVTDMPSVVNQEPIACREAISSSGAVAETDVADAGADAVNDAEREVWLREGTNEVIELATACNNSVAEHQPAGASSVHDDDDKDAMMIHEEDAAMMQSSSQLLDAPGELAEGDVHSFLDVELCQQVALNDVEAVRTLIHGGADPNSLDYNESTLLHIACRHDSVAVAQLLLSHGADCTLLDRERHTALDVASIEGHAEVVEMLERHMADSHSSPVVNTATIHGGRALTSRASSNLTSVYAGVAAAGGGCSAAAHHGAAETTNIDQYASEMSSPILTQHMLDFSSVPQPMVGSLIVIMMGLPGRAKTFVAHQIRRYFQWNGLPSFIFVDQYYRKRAEEIVMGGGGGSRPDGHSSSSSATASASGASPKAEPHVSSRDYADVEKLSADLIATALTHYVTTTSGVAILDARMSSHARRNLLLRAIRKTRLIRSTRVIVVEIVVNNPENVRRNVRMKLETIVNPPDNFEELYYKLMAQHEAVYETLNPVTDANLSYIRIDDEENISLNMISGWMPTRLAYMLHNLYNSPQDLYLTCPGEYVDMIAERIGGNSRLTERGEAYARALYEYFLRELPAPMALFVMSSCAKRCRQTVEHFVRSCRPPRRSEQQGSGAGSSAGGSDTEAGEPHDALPGDCDHDITAATTTMGGGQTTPHSPRSALESTVEFFPTLDDVNHGDCEGMSFAEVLQTMPSTLQYISDDPYYTAWPNGECIHQVFNDRLEPHIHDIQASSLPVLVCSHVELLQGLYAYFVSSNEENAVTPQEAYRIKIPYESVVKIRVVGVKRVAEIIDLSSEVEKILYQRANIVTSCTQPRTLYNPYQVPWYRYLDNPVNKSDDTRSASNDKAS